MEAMKKAGVTSIYDVYSRQFWMKAIIKKCNPLKNDIKHP